MILEACAGAAVIACAIAIIYILRRPRGPVSVERSADGGNMRLRLRANRDLRRIELKAPEKPGEIHLVRAALRRGDLVEFSFPLPQGPVHLVVEDDGGEHTIEIAP
jgi:hypothetical protein